MPEPVARYRRWRRWLAVLTLTLVLVSSLAGCWSREEIDALAFASAVGLDRDPETGLFAMTARVVKPEAISTGTQGGTPQERAFWVVSSAGRTVFEALRGFQQLAPRRLYLAHGRVLVLGEQLARDGLLQIMDFLDRYGEIRRTLKVIVVRGATAQRFLETEYELSPAPDEGLEMQLELSRAWLGTVAVVSLNDFYIALETAGLEPTAAAAELVEKHPGGLAGEVTRAEIKVSPLIGGAAVFRQDRLVGWLEPLEARGLLWATGQVRSAVVVVPGLGEPDRLASLDIRRAKTRVEPLGLKDRPAMRVSIELEASLGEVQGPVDPVLWPAYVDLLEAQLADAIEGEIRTALQRCQQEFGADVFGFGAVIHRTSPSAWRQLEAGWDEVFRVLPVEIQVQVQIRSAGINERTLRLR